MKRLILLIVSVVVACFSAFSHDFMFKHLEVKDGMPSNQINAIYKDSLDNIWIGSYGKGLYKYSSSDRGINQLISIRKTHSPNGSASLPDNYIEKIVEDSEGRLWIRTGENGYVIYNWDTESFVCDVRSRMWDIGIDGTPRYVFVDKQKNTWFAIDGKGCYCYRPGEKNAVSLSL